MMLAAHVAVTLRMRDRSRVREPRARLATSSYETRGAYWSRPTESRACARRLEAARSSACEAHASHATRCRSISAILEGSSPERARSTHACRVPSSKCCIVSLQRVECLHEFLL